MSKTYRCRVKKDIREIVRKSDEIEYKVSLLDILDPDEMTEEYKKALKSLGAKESPDGKLSLDVDGVTLTVDPKEKTVKARLEDEKEVRESIDREVDVFEWTDAREAAQKKAEEDVSKEFDKKIEAEGKVIEDQVRRKLEKAEEKIREKLREAANEAHKAALRKKAHKIGRVIQDREESMENGDKRMSIEIEINGG